jgi:tetratricopeptide (TPR) repeat protein
VTALLPRTAGQWDRIETSERFAGRIRVDVRPIAWRLYEEGVRELAGDGKHDDAARQLGTSVSAAHAAGLLGEMDINLLGYEHLGRGETPLAIAVFRCNVDKHPESANVYDSLGETYMESGEHERAIRMYRRSLELDPGNTNASVIIERMRETHGG